MYAWIIAITYKMPTLLHACTTGYKHAQQVTYLTISMATSAGESL